jgi:hypothetical protein
MTNITTLRHFAQHAHTDEQRRAADQLAQGQFSDTMGLAPVQVERVMQSALDLGGIVLLLTIGWLAGIITTVLVLT